MGTFTLYAIKYISLGRNHTFPPTYLKLPFLQIFQSYVKLPGDSKEIISRRSPSINLSEILENKYLIWKDLEILLNLVIQFLGYISTGSTMKEFPRLSRSMRANTNLECPRNIRNQEDRIAVQIWRNKLSRKTLSWKELKSFLMSKIPSPDWPPIDKLLKEMWQLTKELITTDVTTELIDDSSIYILQLFVDAKMILVRHTVELRKLFGTVNQKIVEKIFSVIGKLNNLLNDECLEYIRNCYTNGGPENGTENSSNGFGHRIKFQYPDEVMPDTSLLRDLSVSTSNELQSVATFTMKQSEQPISQSTGVTKKYNRNWLLSHVNPNIIDSLIQLLKGGRSNDDIQNDLLELIGFDNFDVLQKILQNRTTIVDQITIADHKKQLKDRVLKLQQEKRSVGLGAQVIVQSEHERQMKKQIRKDEKKLKSLLAAGQLSDDEEEIERQDVMLAKKIMLKQQEQLLQTQRKPLLLNQATVRTVPIQYRIKFPFVFDSTIEAKSHIGFLSGSKLLLPDTVKRIDNRQYEEVQIPACDPVDLTSIIPHLIQVNQLDDIGQIVFEGVKELNRIQSIVYPTAYHTNENLLVCAPTGAGKTNVALLTICHTLRSFSDQGLIHRDQFKIVYVAPMKALAAEMVQNFGRKLKPLNILVRELTGDMQLTKLEMQQTQMLVTTPEKWDVVTRKGSGDVALISLVKLLIIDEVHLLHGERGPVVEALVARTLRLVESQQTMIRIVGLSATLPNYIDVARFLRVNPMVGLFYFDGRFRPVPLAQNFIGVKSVKPLQQLADMDRVCFDKCIEQLRNGHQVMVFVHARNATVRMANVLRETAQQTNQLPLFGCEESSAYGLAKRAMDKSRNKQLVEMFQCGIAFHHAGMLRADRSMVERNFSDGFIKVIVCTATLAWGVNLPAHAVVIRGTEIYDSKHGSFVDLGILDVLQIFGRAGRPQYDTSGIGNIITTHDKLSHYLSLLTNQFPIESNFIQCLADNLNAEITLGTISTVDEAIEWLSYTYLFVRMRINPLVYGINYSDVQQDHSLEQKRRELIRSAAMKLDKAQMIRYNTRTGDLNATDLGRTASHFYIKYDTVEIFNDMIRPIMNDSEILAMIAHAQEFEQLKVRDDELDELDELTRDWCQVAAMGGSENIHGKVNILMQTYLSRGFIKSFSLASDMSYIIQNVVRIVRALFTIELRRNNSIMCGRLLQMSMMFERQQWDFETPMRQFVTLPFDVIEKIENRGLSVHTLRDMEPGEIGAMLRNQRYGTMVSKAATEFPMLEIETSLQPITRTVLRIRVFVTADFKWNDRVHGKTSVSFWIWIEDPESNFIYHSELFQLTRKMVVTGDPQELVITIPLKDPLPPQYYIRTTSDTWLGSHSCVPLSFKHLILPEQHPPHTDLLPLAPLPISVLRNKSFESLYPFTHFNPIQTQIFHCLYHTDNNVLLGAPTGSGKTIAAEMAIMRVFNVYPDGKIVYIAPLKALVRERIEDWKERYGKRLGKRVVELTGDVTPDVRAIRSSDVIVTTPEKWDGISRSWQTRDYVRDVRLIVIDEIHLLGEDRGPVLEVIVSRTRFIASHTERTLRIVGLSTALANARDLANWLGIEQMGLYNFKPSVRPVPLSVHIMGFPGKHYCPRMATMNRPAYQAIRQYSPCTPTLIFVSSRRQTRLTALDMIAFLAVEDDPKQFVHITEPELEQISSNIKDSNLKLTLAFGIGIHHAGLHERDRKTVEELFLHRKIQVLVATATLAWGVNLPAHLVIIKGTEYYDGKIKRYVDMPITDVLQMMGRAGRPQFGTDGIACVLVHDAKKNFYKKFLYDPFPVESSLLNVLPDHVNAEIVAGTVQTRQAILDYLTWTYLFRRILRNPTYYNLDNIEPEAINFFLSNLVESVLTVLFNAGCIYIDDEEQLLRPTSMGRIASYYYLSHQSMTHFAQALNGSMSEKEVLQAMCDAYEFNQQPVRHNEDKYNGDLSKLCRYSVDPYTLDSPHSKTFLLVQAHFSRLPLPNTDYFTDTKSVMDQSLRILQAMIDISAEQGWLVTTIQIQLLMQSIIQAQWQDDPVFLSLPHVTEVNAPIFTGFDTGLPYITLPGLKEMCHRKYERLAVPLREEFNEAETEDIYRTLCDMPTVHVTIGLYLLDVDGRDVLRMIDQPMDRDCWIEVFAGQEYTVQVNLHRLGPTRDSYKINCPKFPKGKDEGWFLTIGNCDKRELLALKRISYKRPKTSHECTILTPNNQGRVIYTLFLISDGYIGWDQQYKIQLEVIEPPVRQKSDKW